MLRIDARGIYYRDLNRMVKEAAAAGERDFVLDNVNGQRYIGSGIDAEINIEVNGVPGNDLAAFMNGPRIRVAANAQDGIGNTMNAGNVVVDGMAGDVLGYGMRGGKIFIRGDVGYRVGIHMKEYRKQVPVLIAGGCADAFFGEYMAGGILVLLGLDRPAGKPVAGDYLGTGMHGGVIYLRGEVDPYRIGREVSAFALEESDEKVLRPLLKEYCECFGLNLEEIQKDPFVKLKAVSNRPYGRLYCY